MAMQMKRVFSWINRNKQRIHWTIVALFLGGAGSVFAVGQYEQYKREQAKAEIKTAWQDFVSDGGIATAEKPFIDAATVYWSSYLDLLKRYAEVSKTLLDSPACAASKYDPSCTRFLRQNPSYELSRAFERTLKNNPVDGFLIQPPALLREMSSGDRALMITLTEEYLRRMRAFGYDDKTALELVDPQSRDDLERLMGLVGSPLQRRWTEPFTLAAYQEVVSAIEAKHDVPGASNAFEFDGAIRPPLCQRAEIRALTPEVNWCMSRVRLGIVKNREKPF